MSSLFSNVSGTYNLAAPEVIVLGGNYIKAGRSVVGIPFLWIRYLAKIAQIFSPQNEYKGSSLDLTHLLFCIDLLDI